MVRRSGLDPLNDSLLLPSELCSMHRGQTKLINHVFSSHFSDEATYD